MFQQSHTHTKASDSHLSVHGNSIEGIHDIVLVRATMYMKILKKEKKMILYSCFANRFKYKSTSVKNKNNGTLMAYQGEARNMMCIIVLQSLPLEQSTHGMLVKALRLNMESSTQKSPSLRQMFTCGGHFQTFKPHLGYFRK